MHWCKKYTYLINVEVFMTFTLLYVLRLRQKTGLQLSLDRISIVFSSFAILIKYYNRLPFREGDVLQYHLWNLKCGHAKTMNHTVCGQDHKNKIIRSARSSSIYVFLKLYLSEGCVIVVYLLNMRIHYVYRAE